jgi:8-oxo-dGTP pyrophosphatase MutT (NUDIX family)
LVVHPTGAAPNKWSIPKGLKSNNESPWFAAKRELKEETNIDLNETPNEFFKYIGTEPYQFQHKTLKGFLVETDMVLPAKYLICNSKFIDNNGQKKPEVDNHQWVFIDIALEVIQPEQKKMFIKYWGYLFEKHTTKKMIK